MSKAKTKAEEIIKNFMSLDNVKIEVFLDGRNSKYYPLTLTEAKQCALLMVNEVLSISALFDTEQVKYSDGTYAREYVEVPNKFWSEVKKEIENY